MIKIFGLIFLILQIHSVTSQRRDRLLRDEYLERGQRIVSTNGVYSLVMRRTNGNLAILESLPGRPTITIMEQNTRGRGDVFRMQNDGNAVLYGERGFVWFETRTQNRNARFIMMQDDGDLVVYNSSNRPIWRSGSARQRIFPQSAGINSTNIIVRSFPQESIQKREMETLNKGNDKDKMFTGQWFARKDKNYLESENGMYTLGFREDGNFGIEERNGKSLWKIGAGQADSIVFHPNGNLALFANNTVQTENLLWESNTRTDEGVKVKVLLLRNNGNLVILDENNKVKWESGTAQKGQSDRAVMPGNWKRSTTTTTTTTESTTTTVAVERSVDLNKNGTDWFVKNWNDGNIALVLPLAVDGLDDATKKLVMAHVKSNEKLGDAYAQNKFVYNKSWEDLIKRIAGNVEATPRGWGLGWGLPFWGRR